MVPRADRARPGWFHAAGLREDNGRLDPGASDMAGGTQGGPPSTLGGAGGGGGQVESSELLSDDASRRWRVSLPRNFFDPVGEDDATGVMQ